MKRTFAMAGLAVVALALGLSTQAQPPGRDDGGPPPRGRMGPPGGFRLGSVLPPHLAEDLDLTQEQRKEIAKIEKEVRAKLEKLLTRKQKALIEAHRPRGERGEGDRPGPPERRDRPGREEGPAAKAPAPAGIQWFATLRTAKAEAERTGRPILLVSAAPHCAGVSGIW